MKEGIAIENIDIKIGNKTISLKPEQAKELKRILNEMFEEKVVHEHHWNKYWWNYPYVTPLWTATCDVTTSGTLTNSTDYNSGNVTLCLNPT